MTSTPSAKSPANPAFKQVLVYDPSVEQVEVLLQGLDAGVDAIPITAGDEPMKTLEQLINDPQLARLHVLGHGAPGEVILGGQRIDAQSFAHRQPLPRNESHSFQIAFWSCNTGHGEIGMNFLNTVANSTGANVYGSTGLVGHEDKGGSWQLDVHAAPQAPFSARAREGFRQVLPGNPPTLTLVNAGATFTEGGSSAVPVFSSGSLILGGGERINAITLVITGVAAGSSERIIFNGMVINLGSTQAATTPAVSGTSFPITYAVNFSAGTATVSITNINPSVTDPDT
jgi:hypothetical protein